MFIARNKEFYRDRGSMIWNLLFPFLIILGFSLIFNQDKQALYKVGVIVKEASTQISPKGKYKIIKDTKFIEYVEFKSQKKAIDKLGHHRIDLLIDPVQKKYWVSKSSPKGYLVEKLLIASQNKSKPTIKKESIEGNEVPYVLWLFPGILGMNIMFSALFGIGYSVVRYRRNGVLKRLSVAPVKPYEFITAQILSRMFLIMITSTIVFAGCSLAYGFETKGSYLTLLLVFFLGGFSVISLAFLVSCRTGSQEFASALLNLITWPMMFLSEIWFSLEGANEWIIKLSKIFPLTYLLDAARKVMNDGASLVDIKLHIIVLSVMSVVFISLGSLLFRWNEN